MKILLVLILILCGCEHKRPVRNRDKIKDHVSADTVFVEVPCDDEDFTPPSDSILRIAFPEYMVILVDQKYFRVVSGLLDAATADLKDEKLNGNLWSYLNKLYPEVSTGSWTLYRNNDILYIKQRTE